MNAAEITTLLLKLPAGNDGIKSKKGNGHVNLLNQIKWEIEKTKDITITIRRKQLRQLLEREFFQYACELKQLGICICPSDF